jgi:hypothetical protein
MAVSWAWIGIPVVLVANMINGSAYEDLSRSVASYNGPSDKVTFELHQFGYKLRWNDQVFDQNDSKILDILSTDAQGKALVESYQTKHNIATAAGWTGLAGSVVGVLVTVSSGGSGDLQGAGTGILLGGAGIVTWVISSFVGASAEADLVEGVRLYDKNH